MQSPFRDERTVLPSLTGLCPPFTHSPSTKVLGYSRKPPRYQAPPAIHAALDAMFPLSRRDCPRLAGRQVRHRRTQPPDPPHKRTTAPGGAADTRPPDILSPLPGLWSFYVWICGCHHWLFSGCPSGTTTALPHPAHFPAFIAASIRSRAFLAPIIFGWSAPKVFCRPLSARWMKASASWSFFCASRDRARLKQD